MLVDVERPNVADSYQALVSIPLVTFAGNVLALDKFLKDLLRQFAAILLLAFAGVAGLLHLWGVDAVEPNTLTGNYDGVSVDNPGGAGGVGVGREREKKKCNYGWAKHHRGATHVPVVVSRIPQRPLPLLACPECTQSPVSSRPQSKQL